MIGSSAQLPVQLPRAEERLTRPLTDEEVRKLLAYVAGFNPAQRDREIPPVPRVIEFILATGVQRFPLGRASAYALRLQLDPDGGRA
jgi:hypothetical protein